MDKSDIIEVAGTGAAVAIWTYGALFTNEQASLLWFLAAGTMGGAVLGAMGGKSIGILDMGMKNLVAKIVANICVVLMFGPLLLGWALQKFEGVADPQAIAAATGGALSLFGTSLLIMVVPTLAAWVRFIVWKKLPQPPATTEIVTTITTTNPAPPPPNDSVPKP